MDGPSPRLLANFVRSLGVLALPAADQVAWLGSLGVLDDPPSTDELALELDDGFRLAPQFVAAGWLPPSVLDPLRQLDDVLAAMSGQDNAELWVGTGCARPRSQMVRSPIKGQGDLVPHLTEAADLSRAGQHARSPPLDGNDERSRRGR
jgi:hypothetical protein